MCGVVAAIGSGVTKTVFESLKLLEHRGIRQTVLETRCGAVGHVRLPIVGLGQEHDQPMRRGSYTISFVGEVLDFREVPGEQGKYECDAEFVADAWTVKGPWALKMHDGFWGIVVVDDHLGVLHVLTDYLAQKPMYYRTDMGAAASEINALKIFGGVTLDHIYLSACIKWGYCPDLTRTPYNEIKHVLPGEHVILDKRGIFQRKFVDELTPVVFAPREVFRHEIELAVKRRVLSSDVPVACLLSGGVDSSIVYALAKRHGDVTPFYVSERGERDEGYRRAERATRDSVKTWRPDTMPEAIPPQLRILDYVGVTIPTALDIMQEPIDLGSLRPQIALSRAVGREGFRVCLTGDGADEVFGGYQRSERYDSQYSDVFQELPAWHLPRLDRVMMKNKIEVRSPFLARNVVRLALGLPHELRQNKRFLRGLFRDLLPPDIIEAPKEALRTPEITHDREAYSRVLVALFTEKFGEANGKTTADYIGPY